MVNGEPENEDPLPVAANSRSRLSFLGLNLRRRKVSLVGSLRRVGINSSRRVSQLRVLLIKFASWFSTALANCWLMAKRLSFAAFDALRLYWLLFKRSVLSKLVFYFVGTILLVLFFVVSSGIVIFYRSQPSRTLLASWSPVFRAVSHKGVLAVILGTFSIWWLLRFLAKHALVVIIFYDDLRAKAVSYVIRMLAAIPTLILGNAILTLSGILGLHPRGLLSTSLFIVIALTLIGLPTVLNISQVVLRDHDRRQFFAARTMGINRTMVGHHVALRGIRRSFNMAVTIAVGRVIIEAYIVLDNTLFRNTDVSSVISDPQTFVKVFYAVYSSMTIQSNAVIILLLFFLAMLSNLWSFTVAVQRS